jgi:RND family efflux transporter MFP subunit
MISPVLRKTLVVALGVLLMALPLACTPEGDGTGAPPATEGKPEEAQKEEGAPAGKPGGPPPALVVVADVERGAVQPMVEYVGTVYYAHVSDVAAEVEGKVERTNYEEGRKVRKGQILVRLSTDLIEETIGSTRANYEEAQAELEKAERDLARFEPLYQEGSIAETVYDENLFRVRGLKQKVTGLGALLRRLELQKEKKVIYAPFGGIVVAKSVETGEWVDAGGTIAVIADDAEIDVVVDVPEDLLGYLERGRRLIFRSGGNEFEGTFTSFVPKGDVATRTFSVKVRLRNPGSLFEGMEARVTVPSGPRLEGLMVPRDAVLKQFGMDVIFVVEDGQAKMVPVSVSGFEGLRAGVSAKGLSEGMKVVIKGNERIRDGQPVMLPGGGGEAGPGKEG